MGHFLNDLSQDVCSSPTKNQINSLGKLKNFTKDERGATTVEFVLWVPVFMLLLILTVDVSLAMYRYSNIYYVARLTARQVAVRQWSISEAIMNATAKTKFSGEEPIVSVLPSDDFSKVYVIIEVPINTVGIFSTSTISKDIKLVATASENIERM